MPEKIRTYGRKFDEFSSAPKTNKEQAKIAKKLKKKAPKDKYSVDVFANFGEGKRNLMTIQQRTLKKLKESKRLQSKKHSNAIITFGEIKQIR